MDAPEKLPAPPHRAPAELAEHKRRMAALEADPRTAGGANRPKYLVDRVIADAKKKGTY